MALSPRRLAAMIDFIETSLERGVTIEMLANRFKVARRPLARAFREATGLPPHQFILRRRVDRAVTLLATTDVPIAEVAVRAGFAHQSHMSRVLRSLKGRTPGDIRQHAKNAGSPPADRPSDS